MNYLWLLILLSLGILMVIKPRLLWKIEYFFTVKNGEPSDLYITLMRIGGIFFIIAAISCTIYILTQAL